jgi:hypothetical protein
MRWLCGAVAVTAAAHWVIAIATGVPLILTGLPGVLVAVEIGMTAR